MAFPSFFIIFLIFIFVFQHHYRKNMRIEEKTKNEFWQKEQSSLVVRKKNFEQEDYIIPSLSTLSLVIPANMNSGDELQLKQVIKKLKDLSKLDMMNFSNLTNTELRLRFGTANQSVITNNEYTYNNYLKALASYAHIMKDYEMIDESILALEECIKLGSDYSDHYTFLASLYIQNNQKDVFNNLKQHVIESNLPNKKGILEKLEFLSI